MRVSLQGRLIPRRGDGYPNFVNVEDLKKTFTEPEIVELANRCIYQMEYQQSSHKKYQAAQREFEKPIKEAFKRLYPHQSWAKATPKQLEEALQEAKSQLERGGDF